MATPAAEEKVAPQGCLPKFLHALVRLQSNSSNGRQESIADAYPYIQRKHFLTPAERSFFGVLQKAVAGQCLIFSKIRLADLLDTKKGVESRQSHQNRIQSKHVDFVLCDTASVKPLLAIELDDSSHGRKERQTRDVFVDRALEAAGLALLRIPVQQGYDLQNIRDIVHSMIKN